MALPIFPVIPMEPSSSTAVRRERSRGITEPFLPQFNEDNRFLAPDLASGSQNISA